MYGKPLCKNNSCSPGQAGVEEAWGWKDLVGLDVCAVQPHKCWLAPC